ncbi:MAG: FtsH protease activity modulator HflK [Chloroflexi bacterium]|nr:FtsH protease activity modulator HflK [Chloroflexota bacterium]
MYRQDEPEVNFEQISSRIKGIFGRFGLGGGGGSLVYGILGLIVIGILAWLGTGFYTVEPAEVAALRRFGMFEDTAGPGLHWWWPNPIGTRAIVDVRQRRRLEIGVRGDTPFPEESLMITGDENIVDVQLLVQFEIKDIEKFLFRTVDPAGKTIKDASESALRQVVGARDIDDVLTTEKEAVQADAKELLQKLLDTYEAGIRVAELKLLNVNPPAEVQDAFDDVVRAREDKERIINLADAYGEDILPRARGDRERLLQEAHAYQAQRVNEATGQAERFISILEAYEQAPDVTAQRLFLESMERILPDVRLFIVEGEAGSGILQLLNLNEMGETPFTPQPPIQIGPPNSELETDSTSQ